ncbi:beta-propeller domain-containing protein [Sorangium cellulosum]|nr:beta-propeller domain-containing protein [Sorangium cellulosum]
MRTHRAHSSLWLLAATGVLAAGCVVDTTSPVDTDDAQAPLRRARSCDDLEASLKQDTLAKMNAQIDAIIASYATYGYYPGVRGDDVILDSPTGTPAPTPPADPGSAPAGGNAGEAAGDADAPSHSETNTQVAGVDEADIVKTDGNNIYLLHGQSFVTLTSWPASSLAVGSSLAVEGEPFEMFVTDDKVVVYSTVNGASIYERAGVEPRSEYYDYVLRGGVAMPGIAVDTPTGGPTPPDGGGSGDSGSSSDGGSDKPAPAPDDPAPPAPGEESPPEGDAPPPADFDAPPDGGASEPGEPSDPVEPGTPYVYAPLTKITVLSLASGGPSVVKELYFEGNYTSSRRAAEHVRTVLSGGAHGPALNYWPADLTEYPSTQEEWTAAFEQLRAENTAIIEAAPVSTWLPNRFEKEGETVTLLDASCSDFYIPAVGTTAYGLTQVESIDLEHLDADPASTSIIGASDTVYSSLDALYVAAQGWQQPPSPEGFGEELVSLGLTHLHKFDLTADPSQPQYVASGSVPGFVRNQFSLDEQAGKLRVATTEQLQSATEWTTANNVFVLEASGDELTPVGAVTGLAPGETIQSVRFVGNRGYVVTFRRVDPLFVIDLANPAAPAVVGELKIPGFSEYMHPLDDGHLLTIGRDGTEEGQVTDLALQIFDVSNPAAPAQLHKATIDATYASSEAEYNHKAFTYDAERGVLAIPLVSYSPDKFEIKSTLELFNVDLEDGIRRLGAVDHSAFFGDTSDPCYGYFSPQVRRGLFIEDHVYSISYGGVLANTLDDLETPVASVALPVPTSTWGGCAVDVAEPAPASPPEE